MPLLRPATRRKRGAGTLGPALAKLGRSFGIALRIVVFLLALTVALALTLTLLAVNSSYGRALISQQVTSALHPLFRGKLAIVEIGWIGVGAAGGIDAVLHDETGRRVILVQDVEARINVSSTLASLAFGDGEIELDFALARIGHVEVLLDTDEQGVPFLARAFETAPSPSASPEAESPDTGEPTRPLRLRFAHVDVAHAWVHGQLAGLPQIDAEIADVLGAVDVSSAAVTVNVRTATLRERAALAGPELKAKAAVSLDLPLADDMPIALGTSLHGTLGQLPIAAAAKLRGDELYAAATLERSSPQAFREILPAFPISDSIRASVEVKGVLPKLSLVSYLEAGATEVAATGTLSTNDPLSAQIDATVRNFDLRLFGEGLPASQLDAVLTVNARFEQLATGTFALGLDAGRIANVDLPPIRVEGKFANEAITATGSGEDTRGYFAFRVETRDEYGQYVVDLGVSAGSDDLSRQDLASPSEPGSSGPAMAGKVHLRGKGRLRIADTSSADVELQADVEQLRLFDAQLETGTASLRFTGPFARATVGLDFSGAQLAYQGQHFERAALQANGSLSELDVTLVLAAAKDRPSLYAQTTLELPGKTVDLLDPHVMLWRTRGAIEFRAQRVRIGKRGIFISRGLVEGAGNPLHVEGQIGPDTLALEAQGQGVQLADLAYALGRDQTTEGVLDVDVNLMASSKRAVGRLGLSVKQLEIEEIGEGSLQINLQLDERRLAGIINGNVGPYQLRLAADNVTLAGSARAADSWRDATGTVLLDADVDLARLKAVLPERAVPFDVLTGTVQASGKLERDETNNAPRLSLRLETQGLQISKKGDPQPRFDGKVVYGPPKWKIEGVDLELATKVTGARGQTDFSGRIFDHHGTIAALSFTAQLPYRSLIANPKQALQRFDRLPMQATLTVPPRKTETWPAPLRIKGVSGEVRGELKLKQERGIPSVDVFVSVRRLQLQESANAVPITAEARAQYVGDRGTIALELACADRPALTGNAKLTGELKQILVGNISKMQWRALARLDANRFALHTIPSVADRGVQGWLSGHASLTLGHDRIPEVDSQLELDRLTIAHVKYRGGELSAQARGGLLEAKAKLLQTNGGYFALNLRRPPGSGGEHEAVTIDATFREFRASALQPIVQGTVAQVDGLVDGQVNLRLNADESTLRGKVAIRQGTLQLESFGEELHGIEASVLFQPNGMIVLERARARGVSGELRVAGQARLRGLSLVEAQATVNIPKRRPLPIVIEGESMADAWVNLDVDVQQRARTTTASVRVRKAGVRLPDKSSHDLQSLSPPAAIRVGVQRSPKQFVLLPASRGASENDQQRDKSAQASPADAKQPASVRVLLDLNNVEVRRGTTLRARLDGRLSVDVADNNDVKGQIRLSKGSLDVEGKRFEIERGTITFAGDGSNPQVVVTATWTAPEGTRVYADFIGPLKTGKVTLRAEPARTQSEILSLILFGTTDGQAVPVSSSRQDSAGGSGAALGVGGGIATKGLNRALDDITGLDITTRIDTTDSANPRPEIELQIAQDIALSIAHVLGTPSPGEGLDRNLLTLDWRFMRNWSLETTFGDRGSVVTDAIWELRY